MQKILETIRFLCMLILHITSVHLNNDTYEA